MFPERQYTRTCIRASNAVSNNVFNRIEERIPSSRVMCEQKSSAAKPVRKKPERKSRKKRTETVDQATATMFYHAPQLSDVVPVETVRRGLRA